MSPCIFSGGGFTFWFVGVMKDEKLKVRDLHVSLLYGGLEHLKIKTRLIDEKFESLMGDCVFVKLLDHHLYLELHVKIRRTSHDEILKIIFVSCAMKDYKLKLVGVYYKSKSRSKESI
jgi:hypothetical protein